jgi:hypothetical protein
VTDVATPTVAEAWQTIADGMSVHRWYLAADHYLIDRLAHRYAAHPGLPRMDDLLATWPRGALLHLLHPAQDRESAAKVLLGRRVAATRPMVLSGGAVLPDGEVLVPAGAFAVAGGPSPEMRRALRLVELAGLGSLCDIAIDLVVEIPVCPAAATWWRAGDGCVPVRDGAPAPELAAQLAVGAALQLLFGFVLRYGSPDDATRMAADPDGTRMPAQDLAAEVLAAAVGHRVLTAAGASDVDAQVLTDADRTTLRELVQASVADIDRYAPVVYGLADHIELTCFEYLNVSFPGPRQFEKYARGTGVGQG